MSRVRSAWAITTLILGGVVPGVAAAAAGQTSAPLPGRGAASPKADSGVAAPARGEPRERRVAVARGEELAVQVAGDGVPVVMVPGLFGSAFGYRHQVEGLAGDAAQTIVVEPLGIGRSGRPAAADYSLTAQADRIAAVLDTLGVGPAILVGHSVAGSMALRLAVRRPEHVRAVLLLESGVTERAAGPAFRRAMKLAPVLKLLDLRELLTGHLARELRAASGDSSWITPEVIAAYTAGPLQDQRAALDAFAGIARAAEPESLAVRLPEVRVPVVVLVGDARHRSGPAAAELELLRQRLVDVAIAPVAGAGHFLHEERPGIVTATIRCLLDASTAPRCAPAVPAREGA